MLKIFSIPTLILAASIAGIAASVISPPTQAAIKKDDTLYWSFDEMAKFDNKLKAESEKACGSDEMCKEMYIYEQREKSDMPEKYRALEYFRYAERLIFTTINPTAETLEVYYRDHDDAMGMYSTEPSVLKEIYMAWTEKGYQDPRWQAFWDGPDAITPYVRDIRNGVMSTGTHKIYSGTNAEYGDNWFVANQKTTLDISGSNLKNDQNRLIQFTVLATNNGNLLGATDYSSCYVNGYQEGMECKIMYQAGAWPVYFAVFPGEDIPNAEVIAEVETEPESQELESQKPENQEPESKTDSEISQSPEALERANLAISEPTSVALSTLSANSPSSNADIDSILGVNEQDISTSSIGVLESNIENSKEPLSDSVEVPLAAGSEKEPEFPWWLVVFAFSGIFLIIWWFLPVKRRSRED